MSTLVQKFICKMVNELRSIRTYFFCQIWFYIFVFVQFRPEMIDTLYRYAKFQYECGNYSGAAEYLYFVRVLVSGLCLVTSRICGRGNVFVMSVSVCLSVCLSVCVFRL